MDPCRIATVALCAAACLCVNAQMPSPTAVQQHKPANTGTGAINMIKIPVSPRLPAAAWPRDGVSDYLFNVRSHGGEAMGGGLNEYDTTLQVDSRRALVSVEQFRSDGDVPGAPLGVFRMPIDDQQLRDFLKLVTEAKLEAPRPTMKGHPGYTERRYTLIQPLHPTIEQRINNSDEQANALIAPFVGRIGDLIAAALTHPERAVKLALSRSGDNFEASITNIGTEPVCFSDPRWVVAAGPLHRAALVFAEYPEQTPGHPPRLTWHELPLESMHPYPLKEPLVALAPGAVWKATISTWKREPGMRYVAYFTWANYAGDAMLGSTYRIRGKADSARMVVTP